MLGNSTGLSLTPANTDDDDVEWGEWQRRREGGGEQLDSWLDSVICFRRM